MPARPSPDPARRRVPRPCPRALRPLHAPKRVRERRRHRYPAGIRSRKVGDSGTRSGRDPAGRCLDPLPAAHREDGVAHAEHGTVDGRRVLEVVERVPRDQDGVAGVEPRRTHCGGVGPGDRATDGEEVQGRAMPGPAFPFTEQAPVRGSVAEAPVVLGRDDVSYDARPERARTQHPLFLGAARVAEVAETEPGPAEERALVLAVRHQRRDDLAVAESAGAVVDRHRPGAGGRRAVRSGPEPEPQPCERDHDTDRDGGTSPRSPVP